MVLKNQFLITFNTSKVRKIKMLGEGRMKLWKPLNHSFFLKSTTRYELEKDCVLIIMVKKTEKLENLSGKNRLNLKDD